MDRSAASRLCRLVLPVAGLHLVAAVWCIRHGALNPDEGFYAATARAVWEGAVPYRDFGYTQPPLLPYVNGLPLQFTGFGLFEQRTVNGCWAAFTLALTGWLIARRSSGPMAAGFTLLFSLSAPWMYFMHLGKTYALTSLLAAVAAWIWLERPAGWRKAALLGLLGVVGTGCRLPAAPFFALLWLAALLETGTDRRGPRALAATALLFLSAGGLLLPFYLAAPDATVFWVLDFHRVSVPVKSWHLAWQEILTLAPALWVATSLAVAGWLLRRCALPRPELVLGAAATAALLANLFPGGVYEEYAVPFLTPLAVPVAVILHRLAINHGWKTRLTRTGLIALAHLAVTPWVLWRDFPARRLTVSQWLTPNAPAFNSALPGQLATARRIVELIVPAGRPVVGPNIILALEADRPVPPALLMGPFSVNTSLPSNVARRLHLATPEDIGALLTSPDVPLLALYPQAQLNYGWTVPTFERLPHALTRRWLEIYRRDFRIVYQEGNFLLLARPGSLPPAEPPP